jgi:hypothetical protein
MATVKERFLSKFDYVKVGCWNWTGAVTSAGYGNFWDGNKYVGAHRFGYLLWKGDIEHGNHLDHLCRNRLCINPSHLEVVSCRTNVLRWKSFSAKYSKQTSCLNGHDFTEANTRRYRGRRYCNQCSRDRYRKLKQTRNQQENEHG